MPAGAGRAAISSAIRRDFGQVAAGHGLVKDHDRCEMLTHETRHDPGLALSIRVLTGSTRGNRCLASQNRGNDWKDPTACRPV